MHLKATAKPSTRRARKLSPSTLRPAPPALPRYLTQWEVARLFGVLMSARDRALFARIYHYGLRVEEATLLTLAGGPQEFAHPYPTTQEWRVESEALVASQREASFDAKGSRTSAVAPERDKFVIYERIECPFLSYFSLIFWWLF
jgi:hypothetical protein